MAELVFEFTRDGVLRISVAGAVVELHYGFVEGDTLLFAGAEGADAVLAGQEADWKVVGNTLALVSQDRPRLFNRLDPE